MRQYSIDGVIVAYSTLSPAVAKAFREAGLPVLQSFSPAAADRAIQTVGRDNTEHG